MLTVNYDLAYSWYTGYSCEETFEYKTDGTGSPINDLLGVLPLLGFVVSTVAAVALGYLLLTEVFKTFSLLTLNKSEID